MRISKGDFNYKTILSLIFTYIFVYVFRIFEFYLISVNITGFPFDSGDMLCSQSIIVPDVLDTFLGDSFCLHKEAVIVSYIMEIHIFFD